jgi:hypothetical protein
MENYMRQELPRLVLERAKKEISKVMGPAAELLLRSLPDIIHDAQEVAYKEYRDANQSLDLVEMPFYFPPAIAATETDARPAEASQASGQHKDPVQLSGFVSGVLGELPNVLGEPSDFDLQRGQDDFDRLFGFQDDDFASYRYGMSQMPFCGCPGPSCSCLGTTISSQSHNVDKLHSDTTRDASEIPEENVQPPR